MMYAQRNNLKLITIISLVFSIICVVTAIFKYTLFFLIIASYLIIASIITDGLLLQLTFQSQNSLLQLGRGLILFLIMTFLIILLLRS